MVIYLSRYFYLGIILFLFISCDSESTSEITKKEVDSIIEYYESSKPNTRWWWFASKIKKEDVRHQLNWLKDKNFGGVEIAWVYPLYRYQKMYAKKYNRFYTKDTTAQKWLSPEWTEIISYTKQYADSIDLICDFTFGSAWPVAGHNIGKEHTTKVYGDTNFRQTLTFSWAWPDTFLVINHLDSQAFKAFAEPFSKAIKPAINNQKISLFTDSWEIKLNDKYKIWTDGFEDRFKEKFGYDIIPFMETGLDSFPDVRYDYMLLLDNYVTEGFYKPYVNACKELGAYSRVQCLASPTDVMTTYSLVDIPETESMLNNPNYSRIVSSSACLSSKGVVSSETFTCTYGFPATYLREEQTADLKMVADAMFANGVNQHYYHGTPFNPIGSDSLEFFATTYFGPGGGLEDELADFNSYIEKVSSIMKKGKTYSDVAVYIPYEDGVMKGAYPTERRRVWVWGEYEMRYIEPNKELEGYHPLWINRYFLEKSEFIDGKLVVGDASFNSLYIDVNYMDIRSLIRINELAQLGLPICLKQEPKQPGKLKSPNYSKLVEELLALPNVSSSFKSIHPDSPLISGEVIPAYWCKVEEDGSHYLFLAQDSSKNLVYPVYSGQSYRDFSVKRDLKFIINGKQIQKKIVFKPYQSIMLKVDAEGKVEELDIEFMPKEPLVKERETQKMYF